MHRELKVLGKALNEVPRIGSACEQFTCSNETSRILATAGQSNLFMIPPFPSP
jgi:hypothetical protein